jgi:hypothetical protein
MRGGGLVDAERPFDGRKPPREIRYRRKSELVCRRPASQPAGGHSRGERPRDQADKNAPAADPPGTRRRRSGHLSGTPSFILSPKMKRTVLRCRPSRTAVALLTVILASIIRADKSGSEPSVNCRMGRRFSTAIWFSWSSSLLALSVAPRKLRSAANAALPADVALLSQGGSLLHSDAGFHVAAARCPCIPVSGDRWRYPLARGLDAVRRGRGTSHSRATHSSACTGGPLPRRALRRGRRRYPACAASRSRYSYPK